MNDELINQVSNIINSACIMINGIEKSFDNIKTNESDERNSFNHHFAYNVIINHCLGKMKKIENSNPNLEYSYSQVGNDIVKYYGTEAVKQFINFTKRSK